jgi:hypothetical protein
VAGGIQAGRARKDRVTSFDAEVLAQQLAQLGRDLQDEVKYLGLLEETAVDCEGEFRRLEADYDDQLDRALIDAEGAMELRKAQARVKCSGARVLMQEASLDWGRAKGKVRTQNANLSAIHKRIDVGRSLLSREKALLSLGGIGEV